MSAGKVDVLAVMDRQIAWDAHRVSGASTAEGAGRYMELQRESEKARAAVAELIAAASLCAEAFADFLEAEVPDVIAREYPSYVRLRAALARTGGA